ncbi:hypothetical protein [Anoxybacillus flavithermus]|uniref:hypothetical protein n=1 Tax=Anoxybacillus flavithermus TaxID=33934 RepID=UPI0019D5453C|nr:hypothetical protein [Anoxybacillus flavithermus]
MSKKQRTYKSYSPELKLEAVQRALAGESVIFPSIYLLHLLCITFGRKDFVLSCKLIQ